MRMGQTNKHFEEEEDKSIQDFRDFLCSLFYL